MLDQSESRRTQTIPALALAIACLGAAAFLYYHQVLLIPQSKAVQTREGLGNGYQFGNDLYQVWITSRDLLHQRRDPYTSEMTREIQIGLYGRPLDPHRPGDPIDQRAFPYPVYTDLVFSPVAELPFSLARIIFVCVLVPLTLASVWLWMRALGWFVDTRWLAVIALLTLCSYPALEGLYAAQVGLLVAFLLSAALVAVGRHHYLLAGILIGVSTIKPQVSALVIFYLVLWTLHDWPVRRRFCAGVFSTLALLLGASLLLLPHWISSWLATLLAYRHYNPSALAAQILLAPLGPRMKGPATLLLTAAAIISALLLAWRNRSAHAGSPRFWFTVNTLLAITVIFVLPGQAVYDHIILLPGILWLIRDREHFYKAGRLPSLLMGLSAVVLFWPWFAALLLLASRPFVPAAVFYSLPMLALPIRTAASLPFAVLAMLLWTRKVDPRMRAA